MFNTVDKLLRVILKVRFKIITKQRKFFMKFYYSKDKRDILPKKKEIMEEENNDFSENFSYKKSGVTCKFCKKVWKTEPPKRILLDHFNEKHFFEDVDKRKIDFIKTIKETLKSHIQSNFDIVQLPEIEEKQEGKQEEKQAEKEDIEKEGKEDKKEQKEDIRKC